ncbi:MAG: type IV toxin-antitoxin system AbiEi family antitoxin domain-containing protein [Actinobacteria bacterium]|nr:type IV toxin-antitoxin system AbiEi family antitoxin domain-containing protein [Actinomycetota bacterium]
MRGKGRTAGGVDARIASLAGRSHGVATRRELLAAGISGGQVDRGLAAGRLIAVHRGVYRVGHAAPSREATYLAAVRACGEGALLAGRPAAHLWMLIRGSPPPPEVRAPTERRVAGVLARRERRGALPRDATTRLGIPVTTVPRTIVDLAASLPESALARAFHEAGVQHSTTPTHVEAVLARRPSSPGAAALRRVIHGDVPVALSALEARFLGRLREAGLPLPETNVVAGGRRVDCRWPERRLAVELDGYRYHRSRHAWEQDRQREREARSRGDEFRRYTHADVVEHPHWMLTDLRRLLQDRQ